MKKINKFLNTATVLSVLFSIYSCNDYLEIAPPSSVTPENYLNEESQLGAYAINLYGALPSHDGWNYGLYGNDNHTDNQASLDINNKYATGEWKVSSDGGGWSFGTIYNTNYFLDKVIPLWKAGKIAGSPDMIKHYIGEVYFFRAFEYFNKLKSYGDYPIITRPLKNEIKELTEASKRAPRNEVARFIMSDLDSAILLMRPTAPDGKRNRLYQTIAQLIKSRVALYEATWLQNFKGTAFVPGGQGWPGATKDYNKGFAYKSGSIDAEINYFLDIAIASSAIVADGVTLSANTGVVPQKDGDVNPYFTMYSDIDLSSYPEVLLWQEFNKGLGVTNNINIEASRGNAGIGITRGFVTSFLDINGLPWYAPGSLFAGDNSVKDVRKNRDLRAVLFIKEPGQKNMWKNLTMGSHGNNYEFDAPDITTSDSHNRYVTGYAARKGMNPDRALNDNGASYNACPTFRGAEALLNYMEAYYLRHGSLDNKATSYWTKLRERAGITAPIETTINATDIAKEAQFDWAAYSAGQLLTDKTLFSIRRERRSEYMCEGIRTSDLYRWRSFDQMMTKPYIIEGMKLWNSANTALYKKDVLIYGGDNDKANVSDPKLSDYLRIYQIRNNNLVFNGYTWHMAHYLNPIEIQHMRITSADHEPANSPIYQNPYWPIVAGQPATK
ncbi:MAG: RagB/SusD family nutrient uptake outer membrane protein [Rikenellaceae bacterium]